MSLDLVIKWKDTGLLNGLTWDERNEMVKLLEDGTKFLSEDEFSSIIFPIIRCCWPLSGIEDVSWLFNDFNWWVINNRGLSENDMVKQYSQQHGNRYMKQHKTGKI